VGFSTPFILRPIGTFLLAFGILLAGAVAYRFLPVAPLPSVPIPVIVVFAAQPGADPATMANSIAAPLERRLGEISGVTELTSVNATGSTTIVVLFDVGRNVDAAARDVQAAINAAAPDLPANLPVAPHYREFNPAEAPIMTLALTSDTLSSAQVYDAVDTILVQRLSQVSGVAQVGENGAEKPAVRVQLNPAALVAARLSAQDVYTAIRAANVTEPTGSFEGPRQAETISVNGQIAHAVQYRNLVLKTSNGAVLKLSDVANVVNSLANKRLAAWDGKTPAILLTITKQPGANVIATVDRVRQLLPQIMKWMPPGIKLTILSDRTQTIRASVTDVQYTLLITVALVLMVVLVFMRRLVPTVAAGATVPLSIAGTLAAMWLLGYSIDNFSLMAITISVGFVVDDAIVMIENIFSHLERGTPPMQAALIGARQIGFTVVSISLSLVAVFTPLTFMPGLLGSLFHEFAMTLTIAIAVSAAVSLTLTPMICAWFMHPMQPHPAVATPGRTPGFWMRMDRLIDTVFQANLRFYERTLDWVLRHRKLMLAVTFATVIVTIKLYGIVPKGFLPLEDTGLIQGQTIAAPDVSFAAMKVLQEKVVNILLKDPAIATIGSRIGVAGGFSSLNRGTLYIGLKPLAQRKISSEQVIARLRKKLANIAGIQVFMHSAQDLFAGGRSTGGQYQFEVIDQNLSELRTWAQKLEVALRKAPEIADVSSDEDRAGPEAKVMIDRTAAARLHVQVSAVDAALNNAFAQRQISTIYTQRNQYQVVLEAAPRLQTDPSMLDHIFVPSTTGTQVPLGSLAHVVFSTAALTVRHQGGVPTTTISFNVKPGVALGQATGLVDRVAAQIGLPPTVRTEFGGNAKYFMQSLSSEPMLILAALLSIYIVLGVLYESLTQPLTILSTLPSAGIGALLALLITGTSLSVIAIIGIFLLMGIVKKNAIMMVDFALEAERKGGMTPLEAIRAACLARYRPIMMTTLAAILGAMPLALSFGVGAELRRPLGIAVVGGLIVSQMLTLYTTPVVYLALQRKPRRRMAAHSPAPVPTPGN